MTPGQAAYEVYRSKVQMVAIGNAELFAQVANYLDTVVPEWEKAPEEQNAFWEEIATAAINQHIDNRDAIEQAYEPPTY